MSWRNQGITGSNNIPLGTRRRFGGDEADSGSDIAAPVDTGTKRGRSPVRGKLLIMNSRSMTHLTRRAELNPDGTKKRKKRNRWGEAQENKAAGLMGLPTAIMANMTSEQLEAYTLHLRIEEISQKLRINDVVPADGDR
jgi:splicing factor 1